MTFTDRYRTPIRYGVLWIIVLGVFSSLGLDFGETLEMYAFALAAYLALLLLILLRRPQTPTPTDLLALKWGMLCLFVVSLALCPYIWHLRGESKTLAP